MHKPINNNKFCYLLFIFCALFFRSFEVHSVEPTEQPQQQQNINDRVIYPIPTPTQQEPESALPPSSTQEKTDVVPLPLSLPIGPIPAVTEKGPFGPLPKIAADGTTPFQVYAYPRPEKDGFPKTAIIIHSLGLQQSLTQQAIDQLPPEVTLAFSPYAHNLNEWVKKARKKGHEVLLQLPVESDDIAFDPGLHGLRSELSPDENLERFSWLLGRMNSYIGVMTIVPSEMEEGALGPFASVLKGVNQRGLLLLTPSSNPDTLNTSLRYYLPISQNHGPDTTPADLTSILQKLEPTSDKSLQVIALPPSPALIDTLIAWFKQPKSSSFYISPLSYLVRDNVNATK